jgi:hypothetical protein
LVNNRSYLGEAIYGDRHDRDAHPPIVSRAIWEAAQPEEARRRKPRRDYPLSGLAQCGTCGEAMIGGNAGAGLRTYRCRASLKLWKGERCPAPATTVAEGLEDYVRVFLAELLRQQWTAHEDLEGELTQAEIELRDAEAELDSLMADASLRRTLGADRFRQLVESNVQTVEDAQVRYRDAASRAAHAFTVAEPELVESASREELGVLARGGLEAIIVQRGRGRLEDRLRIVLKGAEAEVGVAGAQHS